MHKQISSLQNPGVKKLLQLQEKSRLRRKEGMFPVEGIREIKLALKAKFDLFQLYFCDELFSAEKLSDLIGDMEFKPEILELTTDVYQKVAYRGSTEGLIAIFKDKTKNLKDLQLEKQNPLILVAEAPEKPGNIGALLRTADAAGLDAVLIANPKTDLYNPNIIRSSVGCVFSNKIATGSTAEIITFLRDKNIKIYAAALQASEVYSEVDFSEASAIVVGTEATGLEENWLQHATRNIIIPMAGEIDSMNVSVAAGILIFEARRQRGF